LQGARGSKGLLLQSFWMLIILCMIGVLVVVVLIVQNKVLHKEVEKLQKLRQEREADKEAMRLM